MVIDGFFTKVRIVFSVEGIKDIYIRKYGLDYVKEASGLGFSYTWLFNSIKVTIGRRNNGRGDCMIHYSIDNSIMK